MHVVRQLGKLCPSRVWTYRVPQDIGSSEGSSAKEYGGDPRALVPGAHTTIARQMPQFRRCFERLHAKGKLSLVITVGPEGRVRGARASGRVPREVAQCVESTVMAARFSPPEGRQVARLSVPVAIYHQ